MIIVFATSLSREASSNVGRILPLAAALNPQHTVHILGLETAAASTLQHSEHKGQRWHKVGVEPFTRATDGKIKLHGIKLIGNMLGTSLRTLKVLTQLSPDIVIIAKPLPANTLGVYLWYLYGRLLRRRRRIILDADDFELTANQLTSIWQRAIIHAAERLATKISNGIIVASPFLADHFKQLGNNIKQINIIPTGLSHTVTNNVPQDLGATPRQDTTPILLYIGSLSISSGHRIDMLPDILQSVRATYPAATMLIAGTGHDEAVLRNKFKATGLEKAVAWHGRFYAAQLPNILSPTAIIIDPIDSSIANRAKSSFRVLLAAAWGMPVVTSNIGIRPQLIPTNLHQRFFALAGDSESFAKKCIALIKEPLIQTEQKLLVQHAQKFSWQTLGTQYENILTHL